MNRLKGQLAIVTGGARGIGKGVCKVFCEEGATVAIWDVLDIGEDTAKELADNGGDIFFQKVDITDRASIQKALEALLAEHKKVDILINNAGVLRDRSFMKMSDEEWHTVINVNLTGLYNTTKAVIPHMKEAGYGRVVSASSVNALVGAFGQTNYCATKAGIIGFTKALAREVGRHGITVNAIAPGFVKTEMTDSMPDEVIKAGIAQIPVKRIGTPEDIAYAYLFLASKEAGFISGETLSVNGGVIS